MTQNDEKSSAEQTQLCSQCKQLYAHPLYQHMCSICFKKQQNTKIPLPTTDPSTHNPHPQQQTLKLSETDLPLKRLKPSEDEKIKNNQKGRCAKCLKRTGLLGFECKHCETEFCRGHRLPEQHDCAVDFVSLGKKKLKVENPQISQKKVEQI